MIKSSPFTPFLPQEFNAAIGSFVTPWGSVNVLLTVLLSQLSAGQALTQSDDLVPMLAFVGMDTRVQLGLLKTMGQARLDIQQHAELIAITEQLEKSKVQRDKYAHAGWSMASGKPRYFKLKTVGKINLTTEEVQVTSINDETQKLLEALGGLVALFQPLQYLTNYPLRTGGQAPPSAPSKAV